jgi:hypothetical protein
MPYTKKEEAERQRIYRKANPKATAETQHRNYLKRSSRPSVVARQKELDKKRYHERKLRVITYYSKGDIKCNCCDESLYSFLTIDHINGRKEFGHSRTISGGRLYEWIVKNDFPDGFQILCYNCNCGKRDYGECPHQATR